MSRDQENGLHKVELEERDLISKLRDKDRFEEEMEKMRQEIATYLSQLKVCYYSLSNNRKPLTHWPILQEIDSKISDAQVPITALQEGHQRVQRDLNLKINEAQRLSEDLNKASDRLNEMNKNVERYGLFSSHQLKPPP
jgi:DNA repair protein RAD50